MAWHLVKRRGNFIFIELILIRCRCNSNTAICMFVMHICMGLNCRLKISFFIGLAKERGL
jgi:hypothetical protein